MGDEGLGPFLSGGYFEGAWVGNLEYGSEEIEVSELWSSLGSEGGSEIGFSDEMFEGNEDGKVDGR